MTMLRGHPAPLKFHHLRR